MEPYKKPDLTSEDLAQVSALEEQFERYSAEHPDWRQTNWGRRDQGRPAWEEFVRRLEEAKYIVTSKIQGIGDNISVRKP